MSGASPRRIVIEPNVFISATVTPNGALGPIVSLMDDGTVVPLLTQHLVIAPQSPVTRRTTTSTQPRASASRS